MADIAEFKQASHTASCLERLGDYVEAARYWHDACLAARTRANQHWCEIRREHCLNAAARCEDEAKEQEIENEHHAGHRDPWEELQRSRSFHRGRGF